MKIRFVVAALATGLWMASGAVMAQELKIGYVNVERVLREAPPAKAASDRIEAEFSKRGKELADVETKLKAAADKYEKEAPTLAESERTRRQRDLADQDRDFQRKRREFQEDLNQRRNEELNKVFDVGRKAIQQIATQEKYDLILQEQAAFVGPRVDITDKVIKALADK